MSVIVEEDFKRWTAKRKAALVMDIIQGKTSVAEASRSFDLPPSEIEEWVEDGKRGMENALRAKPLDVKEQNPGLEHCWWQIAQGLVGSTLVVIL